MNFPDTATFQFIYWLLNTPGLGGIAVGLIVATSLSIYFSALRWIVRGAQADEAEIYTYPTSALHEHITVLDEL